MSTPITPSPQPSSGPVPQPVPGDDAAIRALASQLTTMASPAKPPLNLSQATVVDFNMLGSPPTASITISGSATQVDDVRFMSGYIPVVGDTVSVLIQNGSVLILGHTIDIGTGTASTGGWTAPVLSSGFTTNGNSNSPVMYRLITDNGVFKMQWKGTIAHTGSNTAIISGGNVLPAQFCPASKVSMLTARDPGGGSNAVGLDFGADGSVTLVGPTTAPNAASGGNTGDESALHSHALGTSDVKLSGFLSQAGSDLGHAHGLGNSGTELQVHHHGVPGPSVTVNAPTWIGFNGIEYFL